MICKVKSTIEKNALLSSVKSVAVGVSGGADSMCLLHVLSTLKDDYDIILKAVHLNHNLRGEEALRDEKLVRAYCEENGIELIVFSENIREKAKELGIGEEECGRLIRYACFEKADCDAVAVAHTLSDSIETMIFNLVRGTGSKGLCGIPAKREPNIIRPLIDCTREEVEGYCENNGVPYVTDSTNLFDDYKRNYIRHHIVPSFENINSSYVRSLSRTIDILKDENDFLDECALKLISASETEKGYSLSDFLTSHIAVRKRALSILIAENMRKPVESRHIMLVNDAIENKKGKIELSDDLYICVKESIISFCHSEKQAEHWQCFFDGDTAVTDYGTFRIISGEPCEKDSELIDPDKIKGRLSVGSRREGDSFTFKNRGVSKKVKKLFIEMKIPISERNQRAVLRDDENIVWIEGIGVNSPYIPDENTKKYFTVKKEG